MKNTKPKRRAISDGERLDRILRELGPSGDIIVRINRYGYESDGSHASGNPSVCIENRADIDAVILSERRAQRAKERAA